MMGSPINKDSPNIMHLIEKDSIGAEIGVWEGNTSVNFIKKKIKKLYLVDPWSVEAYKGTTEFEWEEYLERYSKITGSKTEEGFQEYYDSVYQRVLNRFLNQKHVLVKRMFSDEFFSTYKGPKLDWVYLDGSHAYEGVMADLNNSLNTVKKGGLIIGDDYKWPGTKYGKPGVTKAVKEFTDLHNFELEQHGKTQFSIRL